MNVSYACYGSYNILCEELFLIQVKFLYACYVTGLAEAFKDWTGEGAEKAPPSGRGLGLRPSHFATFALFKSQNIAYLHRNMVESKYRAVATKDKVVQLMHKMCYCKIGWLLCQPKIWSEVSTT